MHILMKNITFTYTYQFLISTFFITCFISYHISYTFHVILHFTSCSCNCILSSHSSVMLLISCHILYTSHLRILVIFFYVSCLQIPLEVDAGDNCMYPKVLSLYETTISICVYPKVLSLYETVISIYMTQTGPL